MGSRPPPPPPRSTPRPPPLPRAGGLANQAANLRPPPEEVIAVGDSTLIELQKDAMPPTPPPAARITTPATPAAPPLEQPRPIAPPPVQPLPALLASAIPYLFEVARSRRSLRRRRERLLQEQADEEQRLAAAVGELGGAVRRSAVRSAALEPVLASIGAGEGRRDKAAAAAAEAQRQHDQEDQRLAARETEFTADWQAAHQRASEVEGILGDTIGERHGVAAAIARLQETRQRFEADADQRKEITGSRPAVAEARALAEGLRRVAAALTPPGAALEEQQSALDERIADLRRRAETLRADATGKRARVDAVTEGRREATAGVKETIAGHVREQAEAERYIHELTNQLGQAAARAKPFSPALQDSYSRLENVQENLDARRKALEEIDYELLSFDKRKLNAGIAMLVGGAVLVLAVLLKGLL